MTKARDLANIIAGGFTVSDLPTLTANEIPNLDAAKITSGSFDDARIPSLATSKITSGTFADARIAASSVNQHASSFDDNKIQTNLALVAFKAAVNGSLTKYDLQDSVIDEFADLSGIDASASTNETFSNSNLSGTIYTGTATEIGHATGTALGNMTAQSGIASAFNGTTSAGYASSAYYNSSGSNADPSYIGKSWGEAKVIDKFRWYGSNDDSFQTSGANSTMTVKLFGSNSNDFANATQLGSDQTIGNARAMNDYMTSATGMSTVPYSHHWLAGYTTNGAGHICTEAVFWELPKSVQNLTAISNTTTASSQPSTVDFIMLLNDGVGTATINTDVKAYVSRDGGSTYTQVTLVNEGTYATNTKILAAHDVDVSSQPSGTSMKYKIETLNQSSGSKETNIGAVSFGWK